MGQAAHSCIECVKGSVRILGTDDEGEEIKEYRCGDRVLVNSEVTFGCGLWKKRGV